VVGACNDETCTLGGGPVNEKLVDVYIGEACSDSIEPVDETEVGVRIGEACSMSGSTGCGTIYDVSTAFAEYPWFAVCIGEPSATGGGREIETVVDVGVGESDATGDDAGSDDVYDGSDEVVESSIFAGCIVEQCPIGVFKTIIDVRVGEAGGDPVGGDIYDESTTVIGPSVVAVCIVEPCEIGVFETVVNVCVWEKNKGGDPGGGDTYDGSNAVAGGPVSETVDDVCVRMACIIGGSPGGGEVYDVSTMLVESPWLTVCTEGAFAMGGGPVYDVVVGICVAEICIMGGDPGGGKVYNGSATLEGPSWSSSASFMATPPRIQSLHNEKREKIISR
jgi:hypothetical protein